MKLLAKIVVAVIANAVALFLATTYIPGFVLAGGPTQIAWMAAVLTALNFFLKPLLTLFLGPVIIITLGLGLIVVNAFILYILDILSKNLTIETIPALLYATILVGAVNFIFHLATAE
jgi:putative membrane protein